MQCTEVAAVLLSTTSEYDSGHRREKIERQGRKDFFSPSLALLALFASNFFVRELLTS